MNSRTLTKRPLYPLCEQYKFKNRNFASQQFCSSNSIELLLSPNFITFDAQKDSP